MEYNNFGNPVPKTMVEVQQAILEFTYTAEDIRVVLYHSVNGDFENHFYYTTIYDVETGDALFDSPEFDTKAIAVSEFEAIGVTPLEDQTWRPNDIVKFGQGITVTRNNVGHYQDHLEQLEIHRLQAQHIESVIIRRLSTIWNLFTGVKNAMDAEEMMSWPTFKLTYFKVHNSHGRPDSITLHGDGYKEGVPASRTLNIPMHIFDAGMVAVETYINNLCVSDRKAFEQAEIEKVRKEAELPTPVNEDFFNALIAGICGIPITDKHPEDVNEEKILNWYRKLSPIEKAIVNREM